jgi:hypothetical protein
MPRTDKTIQFVKGFSMLVKLNVKGIASEPDVKGSSMLVKLNVKGMT